MAERDEDRALVIGAGPAGLMAAEALATAGHPVRVAEARPSVARKFLMAGKSGLNLTKSEPPGTFLAAYGSSAARLAPMLAEFGPDRVQRWAQELGQELFTGSSGRVFPRAMKASPLLRAWLGRLAGLGVVFETRWRWQGWGPDGLAFETPKGRRVVAPRACVLALGGASWSRLGSDGQWARLLAGRGVATTPFQPSNAALMVAWSPHMTGHFGSPVKGVRIAAASAHSRGELVITAHGLEGGGVYRMSPAVRAGQALTLDLAPDVSLDRLTERLLRPRGKNTLSNHVRRTARLAPAQLALLQEFGRPLPHDPLALARLIKSLPLSHSGLAPIDQAISTAGGIGWQAVDESLQLHALPGVFAAGEMLDWDAPTGGYLLTACLATGRWAGRAAAEHLGKPAG